MLPDETTTTPLPGVRRECFHAPALRTLEFSLFHGDIEEVPERLGRSREAVDLLAQVRRGTMHGADLYFSEFDGPLTHASLAADADSKQGAGVLGRAGLTDLGMPGFDGWQLCQFMRARDDDVTIGFVTGMGRGRGPGARAARRAQAVVSKPFSIDDLEQVVRMPSDRKLRQAA